MHFLKTPRLTERIHIVFDRAAAVFDALAQTVADRKMKRSDHFFIGNIFCYTLGMDFRLKKYLIGVNIPYPGNFRLIQQKRFDFLLAFAHHFCQRLWRKLLAQRLISQTCQAIKLA